MPLRFIHIALLCYFGGHLTQAQSLLTTKRFQHWVENQPLSVVVFIEPDCPISQKTMPSLCFLADSLHRKVAFLGVFPSKYPNKKMIQTFVKNYQIPFICWIDKQQQLTKQLKAGITPEVFLLNNKQEILYQGMIDNQFYTLGRSRAVASVFYLKMAIEAALNHQPIKIPKTQAVGCDIEIFE